MVTCGVTVYTFVPSILQAPVSTGYGFGLNVLQSTLPLLMIVPGSLMAQVLASRLIPAIGPKNVMVGAGVVALVGIAGMGAAHGELWLFYLWVFLYALGIITAYNVGWALTAAAGRQDNISITVGMQYAGTNVISSIATAVMLGMLIPNAQGFFDESIFTMGFFGTAGVVAVFTVLWFILVPRKLVDRHAAVSADI